MRERLRARTEDENADSVMLRFEVIDTGGIGSMIRGGTGELLQMAFSGQGYVLVQPSESVTDGGHQQQSGGSGSMLGGLLS